MCFNDVQIQKALNGLRVQGHGELADHLETRIQKGFRSKDREIERLKSLMPAREVVKPDPDQKERKFEANPPKSSLEQVLSRLSICTTTREPTGATAQAEITEAEFAGMIAGMDHGGDRLLRELAELIAWAYLDYPDAMGRLVVHLDTWGRQRVLFRHPDLKVTGTEHRRVALMVARRHIMRDPARAEDVRRATGLGERRWSAWRPWIDGLAGRVEHADSELARHLRGQLQLDKMSEASC